MKYISILVSLFISAQIAKANTNASEVVGAPSSIGGSTLRQEDPQSEEVFIQTIFVLAGKAVRTPANCNCQGEASRYGADFHGRRTANGETFNMNAMTAAHRCLPIGAKVVVCLKRNPGKCVTVRINDSGPYVKHRIIDLSTGAAARLGFSGTAQVTLSQCKGNGRTR